MMRSIFALLVAVPLVAQTQGEVNANWAKPTGTLKTNLTVQVCPEPPMRRGYPIAKKIYAALRDMKADMARLQPWFPYPKLGVAELEPPKDGRTSWDFSVIDPIVIDFMEAAEGRPVMLNFGTIPQWMIKTDKPVPYPADPDEITWDYGGGSELRDPSLAELTGYYKRLVSWYTRGGFEDEYGKFHKSGHRFNIDYWEVLNEIDLEHNWSAREYTRIYDAVVGELRKLDPTMKFSGLAHSNPSGSPDVFEYFLNPANHKPGTPLDMISYHFYAAPAQDESLDIMQHTFFARAQQFLSTVRYIETIRKRLSPATKTYINELGSFYTDQNQPDPDIPPVYWNLSGAMFAHAYAALAEMGIDYIGAAELIDYPEQFAGATLIDWRTGNPNSRYWVVRLLKNSFVPGDTMIATHCSNPQVTAQGFVSASGEKRLLLVNRRARKTRVAIAGGTGAGMRFVDQTMPGEPPAMAKLTKDSVNLNGYSVAVITFPK